MEYGQKVIKICTELLNKRYAECDEKGHLKPNEFRCDYCYRQLEYHAPRTDRELLERKRIPRVFRPHNATVVLQKRKLEIERKKTLDYFTGLGRLQSELENSGELEKLLE